MFKTRLNNLLASILLLLVSVLIVTHQTPQLALSATGHVVISEIQIAGTKADDEFVELYNPTGSAVDLSGWRLTKKTESGTQSNLVASLSGTIPAHGFFLVTSPESAASASADKLYSTSGHLAASNSAVLYSDAGSTVVDLVGLGSAGSSETATTANPPASGSVERKANGSSTDVSMGIGGVDEFAGNGQDTDNNADDFIVRTASQPQNSSSPIEPSLSSPSPTPTVTPSPSPSSAPSSSPDASPSSSPSPSPSDSASPSPSASPSEEPSASPSSSPSPSASPSSSPSVSPSASPSVEPTPSASPSPSTSPSPTASPSPSASPVVSSSPSASPEVSPSVSPSPTVSPSASPSPSGDIIFRGRLFVCRIQYRTIHTLFFNFQVPVIRCSLIK